MNPEREYVYGTAARKFEQEVNKKNVVHKNKKIRRNNKKRKVKLVISTAFLFFMSLIVIFRYAQITELNYDIDKYSKSYQDIQNENSRLKINIEKETDLQKIKDIAQQRLGMQKPDKYQVVFVKVPNNDYTKISNNSSETVGGTALSIIGNILKSINLL